MFTRLALSLAHWPGAPNSISCACERQVGFGGPGGLVYPIPGGGESTNFPLARFNHAATPAAEASVGSKITSPSTFLPLVPGLQPSMVASRVRTRGEIRSTCVGPRSHQVQVPHCCFSALI